MKNLPKSFYIRFNIALLFFVISATYGWLLRLQKVYPITNFNYNSFVQAHSHVTFLGWGFLAIISLLTAIYYPKKINHSVYLYSFWVMVASLVGMLISFPLQGYKVFSIVFLSIFLVTSYIYLWRIYSELKKSRSLSVKFIKTGILYYYLSSLAIWAIAIIAAKFGKNDWYHYAIYFYLHFLYNGFFVFVLFGLLVKYLKNKQINIQKNVLTRFYWLTNSACIPAYALSLVWNDLPSYSIVIGFVAAILQLFSLYYLRKIAYEFWRSINPKIRLIRILTNIIIGAYFLKIGFQFLSAFPSLSYQAVLYKPYFLIGYIHLFTLGFMSLFIFLLYSIYVKYTLSKIGLYIFLFGVLSTEIVLFTQGILLYTLQKSINNYNFIMLMLSALMPLGLLVVVLPQRKRDSN